MFNRIRFAVREWQRRTWERKRRRGKLFFLLFRGVLRWGGAMFVLNMLSNVYLLHKKLEWISTLSLLAGCLFFGFLWGVSLWFLNERRFGYIAPR
ncbi:MAG: hypothetical protein ABR907_17025 [Terracidiphilus sp.]